MITIGKRLYGQKCPFCEQNLDIELPDNILEGKKRFPFEYLYIHGNPPHGIALFLDSDLKVRGISVYNDIEIDNKNFGKKNKQDNNFFPFPFFDDITPSSDYVEDCLKPTVPIARTTNEYSAKDYPKIIHKSVFSKIKRALKK